MRSDRDGDFCDVLSIAGAVFCSCLILRLSCISSSSLAGVHIKSLQKILNPSMLFGNFLKILTIERPLQVILV